MKQITSDEQLQQWLEGKPVHQGDRDAADSQCCPDFSCCRPELLAPQHEREAFVKADETARLLMLGGFLMRTVETPDKRVYVAGLPPSGEA